MENSGKKVLLLVELKKKWKKEIVTIKKIVEKKIVENSGKRVWLWVELKKKWKKKIVTKENSDKKNSGK